MPLFGGRSSSKDAAAPGAGAGMAAGAAAAAAGGAASSGTLKRVTLRRKSTDGRAGSVDVPAPLTPNETSQIRSKLDSLAASGERMNPLLGLDVDEIDTPQSPRAAPPHVPAVASGTASVFARKLTIHHDNTPRGPLADVFAAEAGAAPGAGAESGADSSGARRKSSTELIALPPAAATWYPPEQWKNRVLDVKQDTFLPLEFHIPRDSLTDRAEIARQELEIITQNLSRLEQRVRALVFEMEERPGQAETIEKEIRKRREEIQVWELKQWKATTILDRELHAASKEVEEKDADGNVVKTYVMKDGQQIIVAAAKDTLVSLLLEESNADLTFVDTFLLAYVLLMPPSDLLESLHARFLKTDVKGASAVLRLFAVLKKWVEIGWVNDFEHEGLASRFREITTALAQTLKESGKADKAVDLAFLSTFIASRSKNNVDVSKRLSIMPEIPSDVEDNGNLEAAFSKATADFNVFASILARKELDYYQAVPAKELVDRLVTPNSNENPSPKLVNVNHFISWINQLGYWVTNVIMSQSDIKKRVKIVTKLIEVAQECVELACCNTIFAIVTGLSSSSVSRLQQTWAALPRKTLTTWRQLELLCNPQGNYKQYRQMEQKAEPPFIPFIAMHLRDMLFTHDGNPSKLPNGLYNFAKLRMIVERTEKVLAFQKKTFYASLKGKQYDSITAYVDAIELIKPLPERHLYKLSCQLEPPAFRSDSSSSDLNGT